MADPLDEYKMDVSSSAEPSSSTHLPHGVYGTLDEQRFALREDLYEVNYITLEDFNSGVLPQSYIAKFPEVDLVIKQLEKDSAFKDDGSWKYLLLRAADSAEWEVKYYARLVKIVGAISTAATKVAIDPVAANKAPQHLDYVNNGNKTPESKHRGNTSRPDGFFVLKPKLRSQAASAPEVIFWWDIAVVAEFKKACNPEAIDDNIDKMLWGLHHIMRDDPCRDFAYGFTIEDTTMKMWYCDRSNIVISDEFDIHKDRKQFVIFCLSILYASTEELGWDASTQRLPPAKDDKANAEKQPSTGTAATSSGQTAGFETTLPQYKIDVRVDERVTRQFITICPLSISGADGILGRGTRVWAARELLEGGEQSKEIVAIKDYWIDADREREGNIVKSILDAAPDETSRAALEEFIVDVLCHGDVYRRQTCIVKRSGQHPQATYVMVRDETRDLEQAIARKRSAVALHRPKAKPKQIPSRNEQLASGAHTPVTSSSYFTAPVREGRPLPGVRCRNRLVMRQVGKPLHSEDSLRAVFSALIDVCSGLELVHYYGWMHRDLSTGNIIIWEGKGILTDFEYAKRIPPKGSVSTTSHAGRTGTAYFMAAEVQSGRYLFRPRITGRKAPLAIDRPITGSKKPPPIPRRRTRPVASSSQPPAPQATVTVDRETTKRKRSRVSDTADGAGFEAFPGQASLALSQVESSLGQHQPSLGQQSRDTSPAPAYVPFAYNPAHDFETLIWIGNYFIFNRRVVEHSQQQPQDHLVAQAAYARRLFSGGAEEKCAAFDEIHGNDLTRKFDQHIKHLHPALHGIGNQMKLWMETMKAIYMSIEQQDCRTIASSEKLLNLREDLAPFPERIIDMLAEEDVKVVALPTDSNNIVEDVVEVQADADDAVQEDPAVVTKESEVSDRPANKRPNLDSRSGALD